MLGRLSRKVCVATDLAMLLIVLLSFTGLVGVKAAAGAEARTIRIGYSVSLSGPFSTEGRDTQRGYLLWQEQVNAAGGIWVRSLNQRLPVTFVFYDDASETSRAIRNYERLVTQDRVDLLLSPWGSGINFAVSAAMERYRIPMILASASSDAIFSRGLLYIFGTVQLASSFPDPLIDFLSEHRREISKIAVLYENFLFTATARESFVTKAKEAGLNVVFDERYPLHAKDFSSLLTKVKAIEPDALVIYNVMPSSVYATRQVRELGIQPKLYFVHIGPMFTEEFVKPLGELAEGTMESGFWHPGLPYEGARGFWNAYVTKYGREPSTDAVYAYMAAQILQQAIEKAGTLDREAIHQTLRKETFITIAGPVRYDTRGVNTAQRNFVAQLINGKREVVWPRDLATAKPVFPLRWASASGR